MTRRVTVLIEADDVAEAMRSLRGVAHSVTVSGGELVVECSASDAGRVERICFARRYACETRRLRGAFKAAFSRLGAVVAAAAVVLCLMLSQLFVTDVEVRGVDASASAMIKAIAMSEGVDGLTLKSRIDVDALALEIERQTHGVTAVEAFFEGGRLVIGAVHRDFQQPGPGRLPPPQPGKGLPGQQDGLPHRVLGGRVAVQKRPGRPKQGAAVGLDQGGKFLPLPKVFLHCPPPPLICPDTL